MDSKIDFNVKKFINDKKLAKINKTGFYCTSLGQDYFYGWGTKKNERKALKWLKRGIKKPNGYCYECLADFYFRSQKYQNYTKAIKYYELATELKDANSCCELGEIYFEGKIVKQNYSLALDYLLKAEEYKYVGSKHFSMLGQCYYFGYGTDIDYNKAFEYFSKSDKFIDSMYGLGLCYFYGNGVKKDYKNAYNYFNKAKGYLIKPSYNYFAYLSYFGIGCEKNKKEAFNQLLYLRKDELDPKLNAYYIMANGYYNGYDGKVNYDLAFEYSKLGAEKNDVYCYGMLGYLYYYGEGTKVNYNEAYKYLMLKYNFKKGDNNHSLLGLCYYYGNGVKQDYNKAFEIFKSSYENGDINAVNNMIDCYYYGYGTEQNYIEAYNIASKEETPYSLYKLYKFYFEGKNVEKNIPLAIDYLKKAAEQNEINAMRTIAIYYLEGNYINKDLSKGIDYLNRCSSLGSPFSSVSLAKIYYYSLYGIKKNYDLVLKYANLSLEQGNIDAYYLLGNLYSEKDFKGYDFDKAISYYKEGSLKGNIDSFSNYSIYLSYNRGGGVKELFSLFNKFKDSLIKSYITDKTLYKIHPNSLYGFFVYDNGAFHFGELKNNTITGHGCSLFDNSEYYGDFINLYRNGKGFMIWNNGDKYKGEYLNGDRNGKGTYTWNNGTVYEGDFVKGVRTGKGTIWWDKNNVYQGDFVDGIITGYGKRWYDRNEFYEGYFLNGKLNGQGRYRYENGDEGVGEWRDNKAYNIKMIYNTPSYDDSYYEEPDYDDYDDDSDSDYDDYDYDDSDDSSSSSWPYETLVDDDGNEFDINSMTGRDSDGNLWESDGYFTDTYHMVDEDDD